MKNKEKCKNEYDEKNDKMCEEVKSEEQGNDDEQNDDEKMAKNDKNEETIYRAGSQDMIY